MKKALIMVLVCAATWSLDAAPGGKQLIAHRGASGYAPEHTRAAYLLAIQQGADFVEQDLVLSTDGHLVCLDDDEATLRTLARDLPSVPRVFLMERAIAERWLTPARLNEAATFVSGIGPAKQILEARPEIVRWAHDAGLTVTPNTFRAGSTGKFANVRDEMRYFLF